MKEEYLAGFFDGEGCITLTKCGISKTGVQKYRVEIQVTNTVKTPLIEYEKLFGGSIHKQVRDHPLRDCYKWTVTNKKAHKFLSTMIPYLIIKKDEALIALEWCSIEKETHVQNIRHLSARAKKEAVDKNEFIRGKKMEIYKKWLHYAKENKRGYT